MKKAMITVCGPDQVGIAAQICVALAETNVNILNISQNIIDKNCVMDLLVDMKNATETIDTIRGKLNAVGTEMGLSIKIKPTGFLK